MKKLLVIFSCALLGFRVRLSQRRKKKKSRRQGRAKKGGEGALLPEIEQRKQDFRAPVQYLRSDELDGAGTGAARRRHGGRL